MEPDQRRNRGGEVRRDVAADDEISEDEKMEKFYALIRNYKEARDRQRMERGRSSAEEEVDYGGSEEDERRKRMKKMRVGDREESSWIPSFKWEDFADKAEMEFRWRPVAFTASNLKEIDKRSTAHGDVKDPPPIPAEVDGGGCLDLKLRL